jgi:hypothetical protein
MDTKELVAKLERLAPLAARCLRHTSSDRTLSEQEDHAAWLTLTREVTAEAWPILKAMIGADCLRAMISDEAGGVIFGKPTDVHGEGRGPFLTLGCDLIPATEEGD